MCIIIMMMNQYNYAQDKFTSVQVLQAEVELKDVDDDCPCGQLPS